MILIFLLTTSFHTDWTNLYSSHKEIMSKLEKEMP